MLRFVSALPALLFASSLSAAAPTFHADIQPLLAKRCASCHRPGEVAPFSLLSYGDAAKRAEQLAEITSRRVMPPWKPQPGHEKFRDERRLSEAEMATLKQWAEAGAPEGKPIAAPVAADSAPSQNWFLGKPDLELTLAEPVQVPADGRDLYVNVLLPLEVPAGKFIKAIEFRPGNTRVVHHAVLFIDTSGKAKERDEATPEQGFIAVTPPGRFLPGSLAVWTPGRTPRPLGEGLSLPWPKDAELVLNLHLHPSGKPETERSRVGVYFTSEAPTKSLIDLTLIDTKIDIEPGDKAFRTRDSYTLPIDLEAVTIFPHMHMIGREINVTAKLPDGSTKTLLAIDDWDFNWQDLYEYAAPVRLPKGTELTLTGVHDNSAENPQNPSHPPRRVRWGEQTENEMSIAFLSLMPVHERDLALASAGGRGKLRVGIRPPSAATAETDPAADPVARAAAFLKRADGDADGKLSPAEIRSGLGNKPTLEQITAAMKRFDRDGDGHLNVEEATAAVKAMR
jgi:mono/diheme cytochrome c family protein